MRVEETSLVTSCFPKPSAPPQFGADSFAKKLTGKETHAPMACAEPRYVGSGYISGSDWIVGNSLFMFSLLRGLYRRGCQGIVCVLYCIGSSGTTIRLSLLIAFSAGHHRELSPRRRIPPTTPAPLA